MWSGISLPIDHPRRALMHADVSKYRGTCFCSPNTLRFVFNWFNDLSYCGRMVAFFCCCYVDIFQFFHQWPLSCWFYSNSKNSLIRNPVVCTDFYYYLNLILVDTFFSGFLRQMPKHEVPPQYFVPYVPERSEELFKMIPSPRL